MRKKLIPNKEHKILLRKIQRANRIAELAKDSGIPYGTVKNYFGTNITTPEKVRTILETYNKRHKEVNDYAAFIGII